METGQGTLGELRAMLAEINDQAFIRTVVQTGSNAVWHLDAIVEPPEEPAGWQSAVWQYEEATFIAARVSSMALASALDNGNAEVLALGRHSLVLPTLSEQVPWQHKPSRARYDSVVLPWPTMIFEPWTPNSPQGAPTPRGYLIGSDCPSFPSYEAAFRAFFYGDFTRSSGGQIPSGIGTVRVVDTTAWIERVMITPTTLDVIVKGRNISGVRVELNSATYRADAHPDEDGQVQIPLPDGLPANSWIYLSRKRR